MSEEVRYFLIFYSCIRELLLVWKFCQCNRCGPWLDNDPWPDISQGDLQPNEEVDNMYQDDYQRISGPQPDNGLETIFYLLADSNINDEVHIEVLYISRSSWYEDTSSADSDSLPITKYLLQLGGDYYCSC